MANLDLKNAAVIKIALSVLVSGAVLGVFFFTHFLPVSFPTRSDNLNGLKSEFEKKSTELTRAKASVADLPRFEAEYEQLHSRWSMAAELLPADRQLAGLLRKITLAGQQTGVRFQLFRPGAAKNETYYSEVPIELSVNGNYHQVGAFMAELANMRRIVTVSNMRLVSNTKSEVSGTTMASMTASAYSLNAGPPAAPAAAEKKDAKPDAAKKKGASNAGDES